jgi:hypothetical protein
MLWRRELDREILRGFRSRLRVGDPLEILRLWLYEMLRERETRDQASHLKSPRKYSKGIIFRIMFEASASKGLFQY